MSVSTVSDWHERQLAWRFSDLSQVSALRVVKPLRLPSEGKVERGFSGASLCGMLLQCTWLLRSCDD